MVIKTSVGSFRLSKGAAREGTHLLFHPFLIAGLIEELGKRRHWVWVQEETPEIHRVFFSAIKKNCSVLPI